MWKMPKNRCTGHCCKNFSLPVSPEELRDKYRQWLGAQGNKPGVISMSGALEPYGVWDPDIHIIAPMVVYLGRGAPIPRYINSHEKGSDVHRYRCKHWNQKTGDCTIYDIRPQMCRTYPGMAGCNYAACTWKKRRREKTINIIEHPDKPTGELVKKRNT